MNSWKILVLAVLLASACCNFAAACGSVSEEPKTTTTTSAPTTTAAAEPVTFLPASETFQVRGMQYAQAFVSNNDMWMTQRAIEKKDWPANADEVIKFVMHDEQMSFSFVNGGCLLANGERFCKNDSVCRYFSSTGFPGVECLCFDDYTGLQCEKKQVIDYDDDYD